jgi:hypothetical protein
VLRPKSLLRGALSGIAAFFHVGLSGVLTPVLPFQYHLCLEPPLLFGDVMPIPEVYQMAASYYTKIRSWEVKEEHPLSSGAYRVIEALRQPIELQFLALSVAAEDLIRTAFPDIAPIDAEFANEV